MSQIESENECKRMGTEKCSPVHNNEKTHSHTYSKLQKQRARARQNKWVKWQIERERVRVRSSHFTETVVIPFVYLLFHVILFATFKCKQNKQKCCSTFRKRTPLSSLCFILFSSFFFFQCWFYAISIFLCWFVYTFQEPIQCDKNGNLFCVSRIVISDDLGLSMCVKKEGRKTKDIS